MPDRRRDPVWWVEVAFVALLCLALAVYVAGVCRARPAPHPRPSAVATVSPSPSPSRPPVIAFPSMPPFQPAPTPPADLGGRG